MEHIYIPKVENVKLLNRYLPKSSPMGTLFLTTTHLIFVSSQREEEENEESTKKEIWILHNHMQTIHKPLLTTSGSTLRIVCWNFLNVSFIIPKDKEAHSVYSSLLRLSKPSRSSELLCFSYKPEGELRQVTGWSFHDLSSEYQRMGIPNSNWSFCNLNENYQLCETYPSVLVTPSTALPEMLVGSAKFRSKNRLPILTYLHENEAAIIRCAQPLVGMSGGRSAADEMYIETLRKATPNSDVLHIIDTRPQMNAFANKASGKGYENDKFYENIVFTFKGIDNIHKMRVSLEKIMNSVVTSVSMNDFLIELANSNWLKHIKAILQCSSAIANIVQNEKKSVLVHCSDGWDRTSQTCAIAGLMLDPYYRTITGFQALIEKDWLGFGHKFSDRCGHLNGDPNETAPIFTQFLDSIWQLTNLFPQAFQFNERYLITIHEHAYSSQYGTFFGNCERSRREYKIFETTYSLWGFIALRQEDFVNPLYDPNLQGSYSSIIPESLLSQQIVFWSGLYCRFDGGSHPREPLIDLLLLTQNHSSSLEDHSKYLSQRISSVKSLISSAKASTGGAMKRFLPGSPQEMDEDALESVERKLKDLRTSIVDKCQTSKM